MAKWTEQLTTQSAPTEKVQSNLLWLLQHLHGVLLCTAKNNTHVHCSSCRNAIKPRSRKSRSEVRSKDKKWLQVTHRCLHFYSSSSSPLQRARSSEGTRGRSLGWQTAAPCHSPWPKRAVTARAGERHSRRREGEGHHTAAVLADLMNRCWQTQQHATSSGFAGRRSREHEKTKWSISAPLSKGLHLFWSLKHTGISAVSESQAVLHNLHHFTVTPEKRQAVCTEGFIPIHRHSLTISKSISHHWERQDAAAQESHAWSGITMPKALL